MSLPKTMGSYGVYYFELFRKAVREPVHRPCATKAEANAIRMRLYGFKAALKKNPEHDPDLAALIDGVKMIVQVDPPVLILTPSDEVEQMLQEFESGHPQPQETPTHDAPQDPPEKPQARPLAAPSTPRGFGRRP